MEKAIRWMFALAAVLLAVYSAWSLWTVRAEYRQADAYLEELRSAAEALRRENQTLRQTLEHAGTEEALREAARERLGLVLPEDRVFIIGEEK